MARLPARIPGAPAGSSGKRPRLRRSTTSRRPPWSLPMLTTTPPSMERRLKLADHAHSETLDLRVQFDTAEQQKDCSTLGMWIFLITEIMFFGGMFLAYSIYRQAYPEVFAIASSS